MKKILLAFLIVSVLLSCEKEVDIDIEKMQSKLVVNGLFNNDSLWKVELSESKFILDTGSLQIINDALVSIEYPDGSTILLISQGDGLYQSAIAKPNENDSYILEIIHDNYDDVKAESKLPESIAISNIELGAKVVNIAEEMREVLLTFTDPVGQDNYMVQIIADYWQYEYDEVTLEVIDSTLYKETLYFGSNNSLLGQESARGKDFGSSSIAFNDHLFDGSTVTIDFLLGEYYLDGKEGASAIYISLSKISNEYFLYESSYQKYLSSQGSIMAQPVQVYTNIENGLGVFAGYSTATDSIQLK